VTYIANASYTAQTVNKSIDHVPPSAYEYEIEVFGPGERRTEQSIVTRLMNAPP
jgi:hypothetical protein